MWKRLQVKPVILVTYSWNLNVLDGLLQKSQISSLIEIRTVGTKMLHADGPTDRYEEANIVF